MDELKNLQIKIQYWFKWWIKISLVRHFRIQRLPYDRDFWFHIHLYPILSKVLTIKKYYFRSELQSGINKMLSRTYKSDLFVRFIYRSYSMKIVYYLAKKIILLKWGASSRWSFGPNSAWNSIWTTTIGKTYPTL